MPTNTAGNSGQRYHTMQTHYLAKTVTYSSLGLANVVKIGELPPRAVVLRASTLIIAGFNDTTGDDLDIGIVGGDDDLFASAVDLNTGANTITAMDDLAAANWFSTSARIVTCNFTTAATGDGSAGEAIVYMEYIVPVDA